MKRPFARLAALSLLLLPVLHGCKGSPGEVAPLTPAPQQSTSALAPQPVLQEAPAAEPRAERATSDNASLLLGNPSSAARANDNLLVERAQHSMSYNASAGGPNWVAWHTQSSDLGAIRRGTFHPDPLLPAALEIRPNDYRGSGYDRGHVCPSGDRTSTRENNDATFVMSNMLPQAPALNQRVWAKLEDYARTLVHGGSELYTIAGGVGSAGRIGGGKINVPVSCWKIILVLPHGDNDLKRITANTRVIAVLMPNQDTPEVSGARWAKYLTNVASLEKATGYNFFSALPTDVQRALEAKTDSGRASSRDTADTQASQSQETRIEEPSTQEPGRAVQATDGRRSAGSREVSRERVRQDAGDSQPAVPAEAPVPAPSRDFEGAPIGEPSGERPAPNERPQTAQQPAQGTQVWVNTKTGVYHYPGARWYGNTKQGEYMSEAQAQAQRYRSAQNGQ